MKNSRLVKTVSAVLAVSIIATTFFAYFRIPAKAGESLAYIETIKAMKQAGNDTLRIVEIAPDADSGTFGYYVKGQEPGIVSNWTSTIGNMNDHAERVRYSNDVILANLEAKGLLAYSDTTPLKKVGALSNVNGYVEYYPWNDGTGSMLASNPAQPDYDFYGDGVSEDTGKLIYNELSLRDTEQFDVKGNIVTRPDTETEVVNGFDYTVDYGYKLIDRVNLFDFDKWYDDSLGAYNNEAEFHEMEHKEFSSFVYDRAADSLKITMEEDGNDGNIPSNIKFKSGCYNIKVEVGQPYTFYYSVDIKPGKKADDSSYNLNSILKVLSSDTANGTYSLLSEESELLEDASATRAFTITPDKPYIAFQFGAQGVGEVEFSKIRLYLNDNDVEYYNQQIDYLNYGEAPVNFSANLFDVYLWYSNNQSKKLFNGTSGDIVNFDRSNNAVIIETDADGGLEDSAHPHKVHTGYEPLNAFFLNAVPNTRYEIEYDIITSDISKAELGIYAYGFKLENSTSYTSISSDTESAGSGKWHVKKIIETDGLTHHLKFSFGLDGAGNSVTFSDINVKRMLSSNAYYYDVQELHAYSYTGPDSELPPEGTALYVKNSDDKYIFKGFYYSDYSDLRPQVGTVYYTLAVDYSVKPSYTYDVSHPYYCTSQDFVRALNTDIGFFVRNDGELTFVGPGLGNCMIDFESDNKKDLKVNTKKVYYMGGFVNNQLFKKTVLEADDSYTFPITVTVYKPSDEGLVNAVKGADLIIISPGLDIRAGGENWTVPFASDFPDSGVYDAVMAKKQSNDAIMVDNSLLDLDEDDYPNLSQLVDDLIATLPAGGVKDSVYSFSADDIRINELDPNGLVKSIANMNFLFCPDDDERMDKYETGHEASVTNPYYDVYKLIYDVNNYRNSNLQGNNSLVYSDVTESTCIRHILNFKNKEVFGLSERIVVLDIEPNSSNATLVVKPKGATIPEGKVNINDLLPASNQYPVNKVDIICMSVSEFVAKNEELREKYDIIYVGASTDNLSRTLHEGDKFQCAYYETDDSGKLVEKVVDAQIVNGVAHSDKYDPNKAANLQHNDEKAFKQLEADGKISTLKVGDPVYNDPHMQGLYYTNVGDKIDTANKTATGGLTDLFNPPKIGGLLKEDYFNLGDWVYENLWDSYKDKIIKAYNLAHPLEPIDAGSMDYQATIDWLRGINFIGISIGDGVADLLDTIKGIYVPLGGHAYMRTSGSDLNEAAMKRLMDYADSGRPLIVDDKFSSPGLNDTIYVTLTADDIKSGREYGYDIYPYACRFKIGLATKNGSDLTDITSEGKAFTYKWMFYEEGKTREEATELNIPGTAGVFVNPISATDTIIDPDNPTKTVTARKPVFSGTLWNRKFDHWGEEYEMEVPNYKVVTQGIGTYYCEVSFDYHGVHKTAVTNEVKIEMNDPIEFVTRFYSKAYFSSKDFKSGFKKADYSVEFYQYPEGETNPENAVNITAKMTKPVSEGGYGFNITYEWWDEKDGKVNCFRNRDFGHAGHTKNVDWLLLENPQDYQSFPEEGYSNVYVDLGKQTLFSSRCEYYYDFSLPKTDRFDGDTSECTSYAGTTSDGGRVLSGVGANRVICRLKFNGKTFLGVKNGGAAAPVFCSRSIGPYDYNGSNRRDAHGHWDIDSYPYCELYQVYKVKDGDENSYHKTIYPFSTTDEATGGPEYKFCIAEFNRNIEDAPPKEITVTTPSWIESNHLDNCSYMWQLLVSKFSDHANLFTVQDAKASLNSTESLGNKGTNLLVNALKAPKPEIEMIESSSSPQYPAQMTGNTLLLDYYIYDTSPDGPNKTYQAELYVDKDKDGKFDELTEKQNEKVSGQQVNKNSEDHEHISHYSCVFNETLKGCVPWKLVLTEENPPTGDGARAPGRITYTGYSYFKRPDDPQVINAVMVLPGSWSPSEWITDEDWKMPYLKVSDIVGNSKGIYMDGQKKVIQSAVWSSNEYIGPVFADTVYDDLDGLRRMTREEFEAEGINFKYWDDYTGRGIGGVDNSEGYFHMGFWVNDSDIKIMITCISLEQLNTYYYNLVKDKGKTWTHSSLYNIDPEYDFSQCENKGTQMTGMYCTKCGAFRTDDLLNKYNMLILGFGDSYGKLPTTQLNILGSDVEYGEGMFLETAIAIQNYIKSKKAVLFCHDTTNRYVLFPDLAIDKLKQLGSSIWNWMSQGINGILSAFGIGYQMDTVNKTLNSTKVLNGYWDNFVLRESLGMDRYGITKAITTRATAIANGEVSYESSFANDDGSPYEKGALGRGHMYNLIYSDKVDPEKEAGDFDFKVNDSLDATTKAKRDLSVKRMRETDHSIAWVPGTAQVYGKNPDANSKVPYYEKDGKIVYEGQPVKDENGDIQAIADRYTQGFTDYTIARYANPLNTTQSMPSAATDRYSLYDSGTQTFNRDAMVADGNYQSIFTTNKITQVNEGLITMYPFNINLYGDHRGLRQDTGVSDAQYNDMTWEERLNQTYDIETTHEQYYQCNMNGDDITVWFALSGGDFWSQNSDGTYKGIRNDAANAYYIYSRGNVTYTGAGHTNHFKEIEAKLFINTLVAAYRDEYSISSIDYRNKTDTSSNKYLLMSPDIDEDGDETLVPEDYIYFKVRDTNTGTNSASVEFYYYKGNEKKPLANSDFIIYDSKGKVQDPTKLKTQTLYHLDVPAKVKQEFKDNEKLVDVKLYCQPTVTIAGDTTTGPIPGEVNDIDIRRLNLTDLS